MQLSLQTFTSLVQTSAAAAQAACAQLLDFTVGSVLRAVVEANASVVLWLQWLILLVLQTTRLATSTGSDVDSFVGDFALTRLPATSSTGAVAFSRFTNTSAAQIAPGVNVKTLDGTQTFAVIADTTQALWNAALGVYVIPAGTAAGNVTVQALAAGSAGNVLAGTIGLLASSIPYVDTVSNAGPLTDGFDAETDAALRARFQNYISSLARGTTAAMAYAIESVQQGLTYLIQSNTNTAGAFTPGFTTFTVNDGSGSPPSSLLAAVSANIALYRGVGLNWAVQSPPATTATIALTITCNPPANKTPAMLLAVQNAILLFIQSLPIGGTMPYGRIFSVTFGVDPSISDVTAVTLNGGAADLAPGASNGIITATTGSVTVT